ncbi:hypothetical protein BCR34DRAFT_484904 [Clohesyomyces aquaticus]|uniref:Uncharacterized protein n=1 Tax=Clohesyomyces aquaticus TaxID=1231657 RepID=A0A1Y1ZL96_9PLEO|nr:hypothetical protein BCR34DRAFT_484904 [Clohesyomyces aquaticus]
MRSLTLLRARTPLQRFTPIQTSHRTVSTTARMLLKEDADRSPEHVESRKQEQVDKQKRGEGHWHEELASSGESGVKADREEVEDNDKHMDKLQKETADKGEKGKI